MKTILWLGASSLVGFVAFVFSQLLENIHLLFLLSVVALLIAIVPQIDGLKR